MTIEELITELDRLSSGDRSMEIEFQGYGWSCGDMEPYMNLYPDICTKDTKLVVYA